MAHRIARFLRPFLPCTHPETRCIHGDEILARMTLLGTIRRQACLRCGRALDRGLPLVCTSTGAPH